MLYPEIVVVGCGNPLFADDGFGPAVIEELQKMELPSNVKVVDAGLGGPHFIFTMLDEAVTRKLIILDIADFGAQPGTLARFRVEDLPPGAYRDAHSWDLAEPLQRLKDAMEIAIIGCQPGKVVEFEMGLTEEVRRAIPEAVRIVLKEIGATYGTAGFYLQKEGRAAEEGRNRSERGESTGASGKAGISGGAF